MVRVAVGYGGCSPDWHVPALAAGGPEGRGGLEQPGCIPGL